LFFVPVVAPVRVLRSYDLWESRGASGRLPVQIMIQAAIPTDEIERLADLRATRLLDTPAEDRFDRIVRLAAHVFDVPIAYIAMLDSERQWFKAKCGIQKDSTGRDVSFCSHTILQGHPLIIPDATLDDRFSDNPLVIGDPFIRFYAGHPLRGPRGHNVGTLCIADSRPREMSQREVQTFQKLAKLAEHELSLVGVIESQKRLLETQKQLIRAQRRLSNELQEAAAFVRALLPERLLEGPVQTDWVFLASEQLGGDTFGYHWLSDRQLAMYVVDVTGHGVGAALLSVSVHNALRRHTLPETDFEQPAQVLSALNRAFQMDQHGGKFCTVWYGVFDLATRQLQYGSAGHPPALMLNSTREFRQTLGQPNYMIGVVPDTSFETASIHVPKHSSIYLYSDGATDTPRPRDGETLGVEGLAQLLDTHHGAPAPRLPAVLHDLQRWQGQATFEDDVTLVEMRV
jgi:phosphoserine phosphatase RsbU/P